MTDRPDIVTDEQLEYLDDLRESGATNMFGSASYLVGRFSINRPQAKAIILYWMESFDERHPA